MKMLYVPNCDLFDVFLIDFAAPFSVTDRQNRYLPVFVKHLTDWSIVRATERAAEEPVTSFMQSELFPPFGISKKIVSGSTTCFTVGAV